MARSIIKYVIGFPLEQEPSSDDFEKVRERYKLKTENEDVHSYTGLITSNDLKVVDKAFYSSQFHALKDNLPEFLNQLERAIAGEINITQRTGQSTNGEPMRYWEVPCKDITKASKNLVPVLREIEKKGFSIKCINDVKKAIQDYSRELGQYNTISFSYPFDENYIHKDLDYNTRALVFVDGKHSGDIRLEKTKDYIDTWAGYTEEGRITANIFDKIIKTDWNFWGSNYIRWCVDSKIRKQILKEEKSDIIFTRL